MDNEKNQSLRDSEAGVIASEAEIDAGTAEVNAADSAAPQKQPPKDDASDNEPLDKNVRLMSPGRMVARRFFRSKLSIIGLSMLLFLFLFCWAGPPIYYQFVDTEVAVIPNKTGDDVQPDYTIKRNEEQREFGLGFFDENGEEVTFRQILITYDDVNAKAEPSADHWLGTDEEGKDVFARLMLGGRVSLTVSFLTVILVAVVGIILGGIAGYFGGIVDNIIMRVCDILICLPGMPIMLILGTVLRENGIAGQTFLYLLMGFLALISWPGTARLVRGQILFLREQEYMVAAEAMGYSVPRRIFKHLVPNVLPQLIVSMTLSLGGMILYESSLSFLGIGVSPTYASWGYMIKVAQGLKEELFSYFNIWGPAGLCIILAVLGFNFIGDGLRDALDPKMRR